MESSQQPLIDIEPKQALYFEGPFTNTVTSHIQLSNLQEYAVCFKVKTTVPKRYCVRPSCGVLQPSEKLQVAVMLQPFVYDQQERSKHKFMIQSMKLPEGDIGLEQAWKEADPAKIMGWKLVCILRLPGELVVDPTHVLMFEGPFNKVRTSTVTLTNPSSDRVCFKLQPSSEVISASPNPGTIEPNQSVKVTVKSKPFSLPAQDMPRELILIKSHVLNDTETQSIDELLDSIPAHTTLKCLFVDGKGAAEDKIKPHKVCHLSAPHAADSTPTVEAMMGELNKLRAENKELKAVDIERRRIALSEYCRTSAADGGAAIGRHGALGAIASVPPILYLILALLIGLILGKFAL